MNTIGRAPSRERQGAAMPRADRAVPASGDGLTVREAARALGMSLRQVMALIEAGVIVPAAAVRAGGDGFAAGTGGLT